MRIDLPRMLLKLRHAGVQAGKSPTWLKLGLRLYRLAVVRPGLYRLGGRLARFSPRLLAKNGWINQLPGPLSAWTDYRDFPALAPKSFHQQWRTKKQR